MEPHYWKKIFIEIATRAIRKAHFDYQVISAGQNDMKLENLARLNTGEGIQFVPEESIRDNIVNELLSMGFWKKQKIDGKTRSYWIDREVKIKIKKTEISGNIFKNVFGSKKHTKIFTDKNKLIKYRVDLAVERFDSEINNAEFSPVLVEMKRLNTKVLNLKNPELPYTEGKGTVHQIKEIQDDIKKLLFIRKCLREERDSVKIDVNVKDNEVILAILTWGIITDDDKKQLYNVLQLGDNCSEVRYFPASWDNKNFVKEWCIVALGEINHADFKPCV